MLLFFSVLFYLFMTKLATQKRVIKKVYIDVDTSYEKPKTPEEDKTLPEYKKAYYEYLYDY